MLLHQILCILTSRYSATLSVRVGSEADPRHHSGMLSTLHRKYLKSVRPEKAYTEKNIGLILAAVANNSTAYREDKSAYRIPVGIQIIFGVALALGMVFLPETPRYLIKIGRTDDALASLGFLHGLPIDHAIINQEYREILANLELERAKGGASYLTCWRPPFLKRQITGCVLQALQQLSGSK